MFFSFFCVCVAWLTSWWWHKKPVTPSLPTPAPAPVPAGPSVWCNQKRIKYQDKKLSKNKWLYDKPAKRRERDHLLVIDALFFLRVNKEWVLIGRISKVEAMDNEMQVMLTIKPWDKEVKGRTKNDVLDLLGLRALSNQERMWGLIPVQAK